MAKQRGKFDYNFDGMVEKFEKSIYGTLKGEWRLKLLKEDLDSIYNQESLDIWDAGCGFGQMALWFAQNGHKLTCCDISYKMLSKAKEKFQKANQEAIFYQAPSQEIAKKIPKQDLVLFHAVIEWVAKPIDTLEVVASRVKKGGYLSILFFNQHSLIFRNTLRGGWRLGVLLDNSWYGRGKKLTPPHPQKPEDIISWLKSNGYSIEVQTAIRVFYDYMEPQAKESSSIEDIMELEYRYCREDTFKNMGRYIHILAKKL